MGMFANLFNKPEWKQKGTKYDGWIENHHPMSRRYITPYSGEDLSKNLDKTGERGEIDVGVESTAVDSYRYDPLTGDLNVKFVGGDKEYTYPNVPKSVVKDFGNAPSKGRFVHDVLKPEYSVN